MTMAYVAVGGSVLSAVGGIASSKSSKKTAKQALALQREQFEFNKKRYNDYKTMYGGLEQMQVDAANKGVVADLGGVTSRAVGDVATQFTNAEEAQRRSQQRMGINPNSGRADAMGRQMGLSKALAMAGNITTNREGERRNAEQQTWNRRESVNRNGIAQMNGSFGDMNQSSNGMVNTMNQQSAQQAQQAGALFGAAGSIAGQYLGGLKAPTVAPVAAPTTGVPLANAAPSPIYTNMMQTKAIAPMVTSALNGDTGSGIYPSQPYMRPAYSLMR